MSPQSAPLSRASFLKLTGLTAAATGLGAAGLQAGPLAASAQAAPSVQRLGEVTGPGLTDMWGAHSTDLGVPAIAPDGRILTVFGDTFDAPRVEGPNRAPIALYADQNRPLADKIAWTAPVGGDYAHQLVDYPRDPVTTLLPGDVITLGDTMYLWVMENHGFGNVAHTKILTSKDSGATWQHNPYMFPGDHLGGMFQQVTWTYNHADDHVYVLSTGFQRDKPIILHRVFGGSIMDPGAYEPWGYRDGKWAWGNPPTPVREGRFGEMCWRIIDGTWVLSWFNAGDGTIDVLLHDGPTANLFTAEHHQLIHSTHWGGESDTLMAQPYGGYIVPGSTLSDLHLLVSQWNTGAGWPYWTQQFRVRGLR